MSNYSKSTNFTSKDALASGNPLKIVKGSEFDTEFNAIATAIATKLDSSALAAVGAGTGSLTFTVSGSTYVLQWAQVTTSGGSPSATWTYATPYATIYAVLATAVFGGAAQYASTETPTSTSVVIRSNVACTVQCFAIGKV